MTIKEYIDIISKRLQTGISREHSYKGDLETLIRTLFPEVDITIEPTNVTDYGNPDYVITKEKIPIGYIKAKNILDAIAKKLDLTFVPEQETQSNVCFANSTELRDAYKTSFAPIDILDYIYAVLHSPTYRDKYKEFLKIDFPRVPYPKDTNTFWLLVKLGGELRQIHLLESAKTEDYITSYPKDGDNIVTRKMSKNSIGFEPNIPAKAGISSTSKTNNKQIATSQTPRNDIYGKVWINDTQYFDKVPKVAWEFYIGGYQPAQKWLKDRKDKTLKFEDILHYQKIIVALSETDRIMKAIDAIVIE